MFVFVFVFVFVLVFVCLCSCLRARLRECVRVRECPHRPTPLIVPSQATAVLLRERYHDLVAEGKKLEALKLLRGQLAQHHESQFAHTRLYCNFRRETERQSVCVCARSRERGR